MSLTQFLSISMFWTNRSHKFLLLCYYTRYLYVSTNSRFFLFVFLCCSPPFQTSTNPHPTPIILKPTLWHYIPLLLPSCMPIISIPLIYPPQILQHLCAAFGHFYCSPFFWNISFTCRIAYNKIKWNKNTDIHSTFTTIQASDLQRPGSFHLILSSLHLPIVD